MSFPQNIVLHRSNRTEVLAETLFRIIQSDPLPPLQEEWIVVQGPGMQRWLTIELAKELGVWAHTRFPYPRHLIDTTMGSVLGHSQQPNALTPGPLFWAVAKELTRLQRRPEFAEIRHYLRATGDQAHQQRSDERAERKRFQLADRVACLFERYAIYRPELLLAWQEGNLDGWQSTLWRALLSNYGSQDPGSLLERFVAKLGAHRGPIPGIPRRVCLFGISSLPPLYMRLLSAIATRIELHLFVVSPSRQYWADLKRSRRLDAEPLPEGNRLLSSLGRLSADFQQVLEDHAEYQETEQDLYCSAGERTMLSVLQDDILDLRDRGHVEAGKLPDSQKVLALPISPQDQSIAVHACHSPMREVEVLHDQLVARLEACPSLQASDIIVMTPEIETYAPLIEAIFSSDKRDHPRLPYRIADRSSRASFPVLRAFSQILSILGGRMSATEVLDLLAFDVIAARFELDETDIAKIREWTLESGIRWGVDAEHRASVDQPAMGENTWRFGLDRLLLGYATESDEIYQGVLPYLDIEGTDTNVLGRFLEFTSSLFRFRELALRPASLTSWSTLLSSLLATMVRSDEANLAEHRLVRDSIEELAAHAEQVEFTDKVGFEIVSDRLQQAWLQGGDAQGFLSGGITFCQLMPMRSIPFRVVCVLGLSDGAFPRSVHPLGFDRMAVAPKTGDRTPRDDDRYLFLEALLSARDALLLSYVGRSIHNNESLPPSVLVGELLDELEESFTVAEGSVEERLTTRHPLQPFSPTYFQSDSALFSYSSTYQKGAQNLSAGPGQVKPFLSQPLPLEEQAAELSIDELARFFSHPTQYILQKGLGLFLRQEDSEMKDREPLLLSGLDGYRVGQSLLSRELKGHDTEGDYPSAQAGGLLPLGAVGACRFEDLQSSVSLLANRAKGFMQGDALASLKFDQDINGTRLIGNLDSLWPQGRVQVAYKRLGKYSELGQWIRHLCLCVVAPEAYAKRTILIGRASKGPALHSVVFEEVSDPRGLLAPFVKLYWAGQVAPLPFFPLSAREFATKLKGNRLDALTKEHYQKALDGAIKVFLGSKMFPGESEDLYISQLYQGHQCLARDYKPFATVPEGYQSFPEISAELFVPLLRAREASPL